MASRTAALRSGAFGTDNERLAFPSYAHQVDEGFRFQDRSVRGHELGKGLGLALDQQAG